MPFFFHFLSLPWARRTFISQQISWISVQDRSYLMHFLAWVSQAIFSLWIHKSLRWQWAFVFSLCFDFFFFFNYKSYCNTSLNRKVCVQSMCFWLLEREQRSWSSLVLLAISEYTEKWKRATLNTSIFCYF